MSEHTEFVIDLFLDKEADVWVATSEDVVGLVLESDSIDVLIERVKLATPELLGDNNVPFQKPLCLCFNIRCEL